MNNTSGYKGVREVVVALGGEDPGQMRTMVDFAVASYMDGLSDLMTGMDQIDMDLVTQEVCVGFARMYKGTGTLQKAISYVCKDVRMKVTQNTGKFAVKMEQGNARFGSMKVFLADLDTYIDNLNRASDDDE